jgi:hypothetical protein
MSDGTTANPSQSQTQTQSQTTSLLVSVQGSSDPALERKIFAEVASAGRQLSRISEVLSILINVYEQSAEGKIEPDAAEQIKAFKEMRLQIAQHKKNRSPERIIEALESMRQEDNKTYILVASRLKKWLNEQPDISAEPPNNA